MTAPSLSASPMPSCADGVRWSARPMSAWPSCVFLGSSYFVQATAHGLSESDPSIFAKLNVDGRSQAIIVATDVGLGLSHGTAEPPPGSRWSP